MLHLHDSLCLLHEINEVVTSTYAVASYCSDGAVLTVSAKDKAGLTELAANPNTSPYNLGLVQALIEHDDVVFDSEGALVVPDNWHPI